MGNFANVCGSWIPRDVGLSSGSVQAETVTTPQMALLLPAALNISLPNIKPTQSPHCLQNH